jgi:TnpA family transposase
LKRLSASIKTGTAAPSVILRKLSAAGANNPLSHALQAIGRIERTLFTLKWLSDPALRQRSRESTKARRATLYAARSLFTGKANSATGLSRTRAFGHRV